MSQNYTWPSVSVTATNPSVALNNASPSAASSTLVAGQDPSGDQQALQTALNGDLLTQITSSVLPTGGATSANQVLQTTQLTGIHSDTTSLDGKTVHVDTGAVVVASSALPSGASTSALQTSGNASLTSIDSKLTSPLAVTGTFFQATQPVSAVSLPLPSGASTSALQTAGNASLASIDSKLTNPLPVSGTVSTGGLTDTELRATPVPVSGTFFQATQPISAAALPLPTGASTSVNQTTALSRLTGSLVPTAYDEIVLSYTGSNVTTAVYKLASATVKTLTLSYTGSQLDSVVAS